MSNDCILQLSKPFKILSKHCPSTSYFSVPFKISLIQASLMGLFDKKRMSVVSNFNPSMMNLFSKSAIKMHDFCWWLPIEKTNIPFFCWHLCLILCTFVLFFNVSFACMSVMHAYADWLLGHNYCNFYQLYLFGCLHLFFKYNATIKQLSYKWEI